MKSEILLPKTTEEGKPLISYSQIKAFNETKGFNTKAEGKLEYIYKYFLGYKFPDLGWAEFGKDVEAFIADREGGEKFTEEERQTLEKIETLGITGEQFYLDYGAFVFTGIIDDRTEDWSKLRDYKTASKKSVKQYFLDDYTQLDLYALAAIEKTGLIPSLEVCAIERKGNAFRGGREVLKVGGEVWYIEKKTTEERLQRLKDEIFSTAIKISEYYKVFLKFNKTV